MSEELRLSGVAFADRLNWTVGGFYFHSVEQDNADVMAALYNLFIYYPNRAHDTNYAGFMHVEYKLTDALTFIGGVRDSHENKSFLFNEHDIPGTPSNVFPGAGLYEEGKTSYNHVDYRAGLQYQFTPEFMAYADVSTGFRAGGFNPGRQRRTRSCPMAPRSSPATRSAPATSSQPPAQLNNTIYYGNYEDIQLTARSIAPDGFPDQITTNAGKAHIYGYETEFKRRGDRLADAQRGGQLRPFQLYRPRGRGGRGGRSDAPVDAGVYAEVEVQRGCASRCTAAGELREDGSRR